MKNLLIPFLISGLIASGSACADQISDSQQMIGKDEIIQQLMPKPPTRGIRINESVVSGSSQAAESSISMAINFEYDSAILTDQAIAQLSQLGEALRSDQLSGLTFLLEGHTDATGSDMYNMSLSQRRAQAAGEFLYHNFGTDPAKLNLVGRGESDLLDTANPESPVNRRVKITTLTN